MTEKAELMEKYMEQFQTGELLHVCMPVCVQAV
jgi:hypothetical protein